jgi:hypothetical protein
MSLSNTQLEAGQRLARRVCEAAFEPCCLGPGRLHGGDALECAGPACEIVSFVQCIPDRGVPATRAHSPERDQGHHAPDAGCPAISEHSVRHFGSFGPAATVHMNQREPRQLVEARTVDIALGAELDAALQIVLGEVEVIGLTAPGAKIPQRERYPEIGRQAFGPCPAVFEVLPSLLEPPDTIREEPIVLRQWTADS